MMMKQRMMNHHPKRDGVRGVRIGKENDVKGRVNIVEGEIDPSLADGERGVKAKDMIAAVRVMMMTLTRYLLKRVMKKGSAGNIVKDGPRGNEGLEAN